MADGRPAPLAPSGGDTTAISRAVERTGSASGAGPEGDGGSISSPGSGASIGGSGASLISGVDESSGEAFLRELAHVSEGEVDRAAFAGPAPEFLGTDRFALEAKLGEGGFGAVYKAFDRALSVRVAVKALSRPDPRWLYRFKVEFRALGHLVHPNLSTRYELLNDGGRWFFTMELIEGRDLLEHVRAGGVLDEARLRAALAQLAEGVATLHEAGMVHRDIKPPNVLVDGAGRLVLLDFGLVDDLDPRASMEQDRAGTPKYMSPEQHLGERAGPASDWFTVGLVLHEALTGSLPAVEGPNAALSSAPADLAALCADLLQRDPDARPTGAQILQRLGARERAAKADRPDKPPFVGRVRELAAIHEAERAVVASRQPGWVSIGGESGIGKTSLMERAVDDLRARDPRAVVLRSRCYERESMPFKALDGVADALARLLKRLPAAESQALIPEGMAGLSQLFPVLDRGEAHWPRPAGDEDPRERFRRAAAALRELLGRLSAARPVVLALDDLQWGDKDSADLLAEVLANPGAPALLVIVCHRTGDEQQSPVLTRLSELRDQGAFEGALRDLPLEALTPEEAQQLTRSLARHAGSRTVEGIAREAGGNPLFLVELAQHKITGTSPSLDRALLARIKALPQPARSLLEAVAVAGRPLPLPVALQAAGEAAADPAALAALRAGRLVRRRTTLGAGELEPYHDRIRETVVRALPFDELRSWHQRLARALEDAPARDAERLAQHLFAAGDEARGAKFAALAADQAAGALAFDRAARLYGEALQRGAIADSATRRSLSVRLGDALAGAGRALAAAEAFEAAREGASPDDDAVLLRKIAEQHLRAGSIPRGLERTRDALAAVGIALPRSRTAQLAAWLWARLSLRRRGLSHETRTEDQLPRRDLLRIDAAFLCSVNLSVLEPLNGQLLHARDLRLSLDAGEPKRIARALGAEALLRSYAARGQADAAALLHKARGLSWGLQDPELDATLSTFEAGVAFCGGRLRECCAKAAEAERQFLDGRLGTFLEAAALRFFRQASLFLSGGWSELQHLTTVYRREYERRGDLFKLSASGAQAGWLGPALADDREGLRELLEELDSLRPRLGVELPHSAVEVPRTWAALHAGDGEEAVRLLEALWPRLLASGIFRMHVFQARLLQLRGAASLMAAAQAAAGSARRRALLGRARRDGLDLVKIGLPLSAALGAMLQAGAAAIDADPAAAALLEAAEASLRAQDLTPFAAATRRRRGQLLGGAAGQTLIADADAWLRTKGARTPARIAAMLLPGA